LGNLCIIPARGGSKRIPKKNIKFFLGKPIISYAIQVAQECGLFEEIMVSTDDQEIADVALKYNAKVPFYRTAKNSDDFATTKDVIGEVIENYKKINREFENICCVYATSPMINSDNLYDGLAKLKQCDLDVVFPIVPFSYPILRSLKVDGNHVSMNWPLYKNSRSQDLPVAYHDAGQWYWISNRNKKIELLTNNTGYILLSETQVQDIDNNEDWIMAELKFRIMHEV